MASESDKLYFLTVTVNMDMEGGVDLAGKMGVINTVLEDYGKATKCLHKYKVTGEPVVLAVSNVIGFERTINGLARIGQVTVDCQPLIGYRTFAKRIGAKVELVKPAPNCLVGEKELTLLDFTVEHQGKTTDELLQIWQAEANGALGAVAGGAKLELFKPVATRKVYGFAGASVHDGNNLDDLSFNLPIMKLNGENVKIKTKGLISLKYYCDKISADD